MTKGWAKGTHHSEEHRRKIGEANRRRVVTEETKRKQSEARKLLFATSPEAHKKLSDSMKGRPSPRKGVVLSEETKLKISQNRKGKGLGNKNHANYTEEEREAYRQRLLGKPGRHAGVPQSDSAKEKLRDFRTGLTASAETRRKMSECRTGELNPNWNGGPKEYCHKFRNGTFRNRCRAYFNDTCALCGKPAGDDALDVHHVYYNKKACCEMSEDGRFRSDLGIKGREKDFVIEGEPNKFVPLHHWCHSLTTPVPVREHYARFFEKMVNEEYDGRCYFTAEEYEALVNEE